MTNQKQMITPPQLVEQWVDMLSSRSDYAVFSLAAQWGWDQHRAATESELQQAADQELDACCKYMQHEDFHGFATELRAARRPKPPSLTEQAFEALEEIDSYAIQQMSAYAIHSELKIYAETLRDALERLKKLEESTND